MKEDSIEIVWFRQDLRLFDNPALYHAIKTKKPVVGIYIFDDTLKKTMGSAQRWWLHHSLTALIDRFKSLGGQFYLYKGNTCTILKDILKNNKIQSLYSSCVFEPEQLKIDEDLEKFCEQCDVTYHCYDYNLLNHPETIINKQGCFYKVYTSFYKASLPQVNRNKLYPEPKSISSTAKLHKKSEVLSHWDLCPAKPNWAKGFAEHFEPGEKAAIKQLKSFINNGIKEYHELRDFPYDENVSKLSPHIHFGEISIHTCLNQAEKATALDSSKQKGIDVWIKQLFWRDFSYYLLYHADDLANKNFVAKFDNFPWVKNKKLLNAWQMGMTGYPIVDAGMRELWHTGFMHNRVRMIVASFLTKDLLIHWQEGESWFWDTLLDADQANNVASWQWVQGCGADAAPYFRIFNPTLQGEKFDAHGEYVAKWVPELAKMPPKYIHKPWEAPSDILKAAKVVLGKNYPKPLVDHKLAREKALEIYKKM